MQKQGLEQALVQVQELVQVEEQVLGRVQVEEQGQELVLALALVVALVQEPELL